MTARSVLKRLKFAGNQSGIGSLSGLFTVGVVLVAIFGAIQTAHSHASGSAAEIKSGDSGYCLDVRSNNLATGSPVDSWPCNASSAQAWTIYPGRIEHGGNYCLSVANNAQSPGSPVVIASCEEAPGQVWLKDASGYLNPNSGLCLSLPGGQTGQPLDIADCSKLSSPAESWQPTGNDQSADCQNLTKGERLACYAEKEFTTWQSGSVNHNHLLNQYTDGSPYEEWCADFVSYVYKEAGYPFANGEADGWDENNANNIVNQGFSIHYPGSYIPKAGDVGYFSYGGGHVEIVVSGGKNPTFIYGNSATIDPSTGNGQMMANTKTADGEFGQLVYYLTSD